MILAAEPTNVKFPATVLTHAKINHALSGLAPEVATADAATLGPNSKTEGEKKLYKIRTQGNIFNEVKGGQILV
jgi:hypothetical protein